MSTIHDTIAHVCDHGSAWPIGHPEPVEDPARLIGPEVGSVHPYEGKYGGPGQTAEVLQRSYVWSPGECRSNGGRRLYGSSVVRVIVPRGGDERYPNGREYTVVVNDTDLR